jgi:hypothetical protein
MLIGIWGLYRGGIKAIVPVTPTCGFSAFIAILPDTIRRLNAPEQIASSP